MLKQEINDLLTQTGPGTPMGALFRQYWIPALLAEELPEDGAPPVRVKLLGERLLAFRDSEGRYGLIDEFCPHRGVSLWFGRNEEAGLRCSYHGWKFDVTGQCIEVPSEPDEKESALCAKIKITGYPLVKIGDVLWTYMGDPASTPQQPEWEFARVPSEQTYTSKRWQECNWLQALEGGIDSSHVSWLHAGGLNSDPLFKGAEGNKYNLSDFKPFFEVVEADGGLFIGARRNAEEGHYYWRITPWVMPTFTMVPPRDAPSLVLDANVHQIDPGVTSTIHRHSWDAIAFVTEGSGWTEINGKRIQWQPWDTFHIPAWSWHRHGNDVDRPAGFVTWSVQPMFEMVNSAILEEGGDTPFDELPPPPTQTAALTGNDPYSRRTQRLAKQFEGSDEARLITRFEEAPFKITPRGARSAFLVDPSLGYHTTGLTAVWHQLAPGLFQSRHRHGGEAWLHCVAGHGHTEINGVDYEWGPGDLVVVDHWAWHQHFNDDPDNIASLIRVHNFDTLYMGMRVMLADMDLFEELPKLDAPDISNVTWPPVEEGRPQA